MTWYPIECVHGFDACPRCDVRLLNRVKPADIPPINLRRTDQPFFNRGINRAFECRDEDQTVEIDLYDEIGFFGVDAKAFRNALKQSGRRDVLLRINSPGGDVFDGLAMMNDLIAYPGRVDVDVTGLAASAASIVAMGADTVTMAPASMMMIHNAWGIMVGDRNDALAFAEIAGKIDATIAGTYAQKSDVYDVDDFAALMDDETWFTADEAIDAGLADGLGGPTEAKARFDLSAYDHAPDRWSLAREDQSSPVTIRDVERCLRDAGLSKSLAAATVAGGFKTAKARRREAGDDDANLAALRDAFNATARAMT